MHRPPPCSTLFPYTTLFRSRVALRDHGSDKLGSANQFVEVPNLKKGHLVLSGVVLENLPFTEWQKREAGQPRSEEHTSELQSHVNLVCRLLLEKKNRNKIVI